MFAQIKNEVQKQFTALSKHDLFVVDLDRDELYNAYLDSFADPIVRQAHNCNCCRQFIRNYGGVVAIINNEIRTLWEFTTVAPFEAVPANLHALVKAAAIDSPFMSTFDKLGTDFNMQIISPDNIVRHEHFFLQLPKNLVTRSSKSLDTLIGEAKSFKQVFKRSLEEITLDSVETVLELIAQNSLYRGAEFKDGLAKFAKQKIAYDKLTSSYDKDLYAWANVKNGSKIRNTAIGTLLVDLSEGRSLDSAVTAFESIVAPHNYKRPTAIVTKSMIEQAEKQIKELGLEESLKRRYATADDIPVTDVLFVNRDVSIVTETTDLFDELKGDVRVNPKNLSKVEEVSIDDFIANVIPTASSIEVLLENKHINKFMTMVAPVNADAPTLFDWDSGLSWSYQDGIADSVKERVKNAGGSVEGELRVSLEWFNFDDLDLHVVEPNNNKIYFSSKQSPHSGGYLDVDMNAGSGKTRDAVENIIFKHRDRMLDGEYKVYVHNYCKRESIDVGFNIEIESRGETYNLSRSTAVSDNATVLIATIKYDKVNGITNVEHHIDKSAPVSKEVWDLQTQVYHKVSMIMLSPNHWGDNRKGNKHTFFILDKARNPSSPRGIFNEFLKPELIESRRVFELLGNKIKVTENEDQQLSGLGFSSTQHSELICKVTGKFTRTIKVKF